MSEQPETNVRTLTVDKAVCEGYGICVGIDSDLFELDEVEDFVHVIAQPTSRDENERAESAVRSCPKRALTFVP